MADLSVTATSVVKYAGAEVEQVTWGETVTAGQPVYKSSSDNLHYKSDANASSDAYCDGVALTGGAVNQVGFIVKRGDYNPGATVAVGTIYVVSATEGGVCPVADLTSTQNVIIIGIAVTTTKIRLMIDRNTIIALA